MALMSIDVVVCDDHRLTRGLVAEMLNSLRATIRQVEDGAEAFDEIVRSPPHLVIADLHMPIDGLTLLRHIRRSPRSPDPTLPVIAMTSLTDRKTVLALRDAGAHEVICKPFSTQIVLGRIASVIDFSRQFIRTASYVGPCRRRRPNAPYKGPLKRATDHQTALIELD